MGSLNLKLSKVVNKLKTCIKSKKLVVEYTNQESLLGLFECLEKEKVIHGFYEKNGSTIVIIRYDSLGNSPIKDLKVEYKKPGIKYFSLKYLKSKTFKKRESIKKGIYSFSYVLSTNVGFLTHQEAVKKGVGGVVFLSIMY